MLFEEPGADDNGGSFSGAGKVDDFIRRALSVNRDAGGPRFQSSEISHAPLGRVVTEKNHAIAGLDAVAGEKCSGARRELAQIGVRILLFASITLDAHGDARRMTLGRGLEKLEEVAISVNALWLRAHVFFQGGQHPFLQSGQMGVYPVVVPVKGLRIPG